MGKHYWSKYLMARKILEVVIDGGRDNGKKFVITEMAAIPAAKWAFRAFLAISRSGTSAIKEALNFDFEDADWQSKATLCEIASLGIGIFGAMNFAESEPLIDDLFNCIKIMPDPKVPLVTRHLIEDDIEDPTTYLRLQKDAFMLHIDFFTNAAA